MSCIFHLLLYHVHCEMQLGLYSFHDLRCSHFIPPTYHKNHSVTPSFKSIYFHAHRTISSPTLTPIIQHREYITVQYLHFCTKPDINSHLFFILPKSCLSHFHSCSYILLASCILCCPAT